RIIGIEGGIDYSKMWITLGAGFLSSFLLFLLLCSYLNMRVNAAKMAGELTAQLRESEQRFRLLADSAPVLIWQAGTDKLCYYFNKVWLEFTGHTLDQGNGWATYVHPDDYQHCLDTYVTAFDRRASFSMEYRLRRHDGEYRWLIDTGVPRFADDKNFLGYIGSCVDITERKQMEDKLARAHAELQQFTHIAAHHLQEPARRLVSFVQRLQLQLTTEQLSEDAIASLHFIEQGAVRQSALVRDIQLYLAADQPRSKMEDIAVSEVITNLLKHRASLMRETGAQVDYDDICSVYIDRPRLKDIFSILLDNAFDYRHPKLTPHIRITSELKAGRIIYRVADNGIGIPVEYRERVFGVFERLQVHDDQNSTGIGLAIVRRIIENCGGSVTLQETPGGGITVLFDLPE
ncbi:MAG: sensor histidine kinase, partial [Methylococcaceae bacterium]